VVIADEHLLTLRDVVGDAAEIWVEDRAQPGRRLPATQVASLENPPVTLLRCAGLAVTPLPLGEKMPAIGSEIIAVNRPGGLLAGVRPEVSRGAVVAGFESGFGELAVHSAVVSRGPGGGPIIDATGRLVGLVARTPRTDWSGNARGVGVPLERVWPLLEEQIADLEPSTVADPTPSWEAIESLGAAATVRVLAVEKWSKPRAD
jgi:S1-C subfamily serine protease